MNTYLGYKELRNVLQDVDNCKLQKRLTTVRYPKTHFANLNAVYEILVTKPKKYIVFL
jgi:hypothetical protein